MIVCPHCRAEGPLERDRVVHWRCARCGAPVVPTGELRRAHAELPELVRVHRARAMAFGWRAGSWLFSSVALGAAAVGVLILATSGDLGVGGVFAAVTFVAAGLGYRLRGRARTLARTVDGELARAWYKAAGEVLAARGALSATELAELMQTDEVHAADLLMAVTPGETPS